MTKFTFFFAPEQYKAAQYFISLLAVNNTEFMLQIQPQTTEETHWSLFCSNSVLSPKKKFCFILYELQNDCTVVTEISVGVQKI